MAFNSSEKPKSQIAPNHNLVGHRIDQGRLEFISVLGLGAYGVVYLARDLTSADLSHPNLYAVKVLNKIGLDTRQKSFQRREIALHSLASHHPSIVTLHAVIESPSCTFVVLDYCPDGDLFGMITEKKRYLGKTDAIKHVFLQIIEAVEFCHLLGISHRDLKPENILCKDNGNGVLLADFGLATIEKTSSDFGCGSTFYMSPECQGGLFEPLVSYSTFQNDIWSLGVILVNLTCGRNPWKQASLSDETFRAFLANPDFLRSILPISEDCNSLLKRIFSLNPLSRISLKELKHRITLIDTFDMSSAELSQATKATREAARAWRSNVPHSPKISQPYHQHCKCASNAHVEDSTCYLKPSHSTVWNSAPREQAASLQEQQDRRLSHSSYSSQLAKPMSPQVCFDVSVTSDEDTPTAPLGSNSFSASTPRPLSPTSNQLPHRRGFLSSRLFKLSNAVSTHQTSNFRKTKLLTKPIGLGRLNAPSPIVVNRDSEINTTPGVASCPRKAFASPREGSKHSMFNFLPFTPPPSSSPSKATFGFISKSSRFFHISPNSIQALPNTPSTPSQYAQCALSSSSSPSALV